MNSTNHSESFTYQQLVVQIRLMRELLNLRQEDVSVKAQLTTRTIKRIEKGVSPGRHYHLETICQALGLKLEVETKYTIVPIN